MTQKLDSGHKHFLRLIAKEQQSPSGWAKISAHVVPLVQKIPGNFVELRTLEDGSGAARLSSEGENILYAMEWL